jgi:predicted DNA-binding protein with PD1-like motif
MEAIKNGDAWFLRLDKGEDLFSILEKWALNNEMKAGHLSGIGALKDVELGFYHLAEKHYDRKMFPKEAELLSLDGNLCSLDGKPFFHIHAVLGNEKFEAFGGHLFSAKVAVTCEINFRPFQENIVRTPNEEIGLNLLNFCKIGAHS